MQEWVFDRDAARSEQAAGPQAAGPVAAPEPGRRRRLGRRGRWAVAAGAALAVAAAGVTVAAASGPDPAETSAAASTASPDPADQTTPEASTPDRASPDQLPGRAPAPEAGSGPGSAAAPWTSLHEEQDVPQPDGTTVTMALQGGAVTALSDDSVTVQSSDGYARTYQVTDETRIGTAGGTLAELGVGDTVLVQAVVEDETATATTIRTASSTRGRGAPDGATTTPDDETTTTAEQDESATDA